MIRVKKSMPPPKRLLVAGCNDDAVVRQMDNDQNGKCYICESRMTTDFEVEHRHSVAHQGGRDDWENIFLACSYCNDKKGARFDNILNPAECDAEVLIQHKYDTSSGRFVFSSAEEANGAVNATIELLELIFNGAKPGMLKIREEKFRKRFIYEYNGFLERLAQYVQSKDVEAERHVLADLESTSEYLGFKYHVIMSNSCLAAKFGNAVRWNKE